MKGFVFPRCFCRDPQTHRPLGRKCPKLKPRGTPRDGTSATRLPAAPAGPAAAVRREAGSHQEGR